ncbi:replication initiation and membrane attachment family protein [Halalkalibacillus halophilus]|uniref:replication initiation and membrane attachment family protein n=1 Tax=Halalkalibacillus halophilus TaxID=392827 RepID=UPI0003FCD805|nr:DnaD domain protein [Halalkalibacillus halophilus]
MKDRMKQLLPNDRMKIIKNESFYQNADTVLTLLYQPLLGMESVALYQALWKESNFRSPQSSLSHHQLMSLLNISLDTFYDARQRLEGLNLMETYKEDGAYTTFYYVLKRPESAEGFFNNPTLAVLLEHHVGKEVFQQLKKRISNQAVLPSNVSKVTKRFDEVFTTLPEEHSKTMNVEKSEEKKEAIETELPLEWMYKMLTQQNVEPKHILTNSNLAFVEKMMKIYDVDYVSLEKALIWAVTEDGTFDRDEFIDMCKDVYHKKHGSVPPRLYRKEEQNSTPVKVQEEPVSTDNASEEGTSEKETELIKHFHTITHRELLEDQSSSGIASFKELEMITSIMETHGLKQPVMNVLVDYVLKKNQNKLSKNYIDTIASHWSRENISTAKQAMDIAKREHHIYQTWQEKKKQTQKKKTDSKEVLPKWFKEQQEEKRSEDEKKHGPPSTDQAEENQEELEAFFKSFSQSKK